MTNEMTPISNVAFTGVVAEEINRLNRELKQAWGLADRSIYLLQSLRELIGGPVPSLESLMADYTASERSVVTDFQRWDSEND